MLIRKGLQPTLQERSPGLNPGYDSSGAERIIFHLDLDAFFAQVEEVANPLLKGKPIFVVGHSMTSGVVLTANYEARKYGVKTGMPLRDAKALCPFAVLVPADCSKYSDTSDEIFAHFATYTPLVEPFSIDEAFMDVTDTGAWCHSEAAGGIRRISKQSSFGPPCGGPQDDIVALAQKIKRWVFENFHLTLSIGIAPNKLLAKLASDWQKPNGLFRIRPEEVEGILKNLPVEELCGIGARMKGHLNQLGIFTAADLGAFPEMELFRRFGVIGLVLKRMGQGIDHSPVLPLDTLEPVKSMGHSYTLTRPAGNREEAFRYLLWLSEKVGRRLRRRGVEGRTVHTTIRFSDFETVSKQRNLPFFLNDGKAIFDYAKKIFAEIDRPRKPIRLLGVSVSSLRRTGLEPWLFKALNERRHLLEAIDTINDKYGEFTVRSAFLTFPDDRKIASRALQLFGSGRH